MLVAVEVFPLVLCVESYLGLSPILVPYYEIEAPFSVPEDLDILCLDCSPHTIDVRFDRDLQRVSKANRPFMYLMDIRAPSNHTFELIQNGTLFLKGHTPPSTLSFGHILIYFDLDGLLEIRWWNKDVAPQEQGWSCIRSAHKLTLHRS